MIDSCRLRRAGLFLVLLTTMALPAAAQVYEWRDAQGNLNYSDRPPPGVEARLIRSGNPATGGDGDSTTAVQQPTAPSIAERELEFRQRRAAEAEAATEAQRQRAQEEERQRACTQARSQLAALESGQRVARFNERGEREFLDDAGRAAEIERSRGFIAQNCGN